MILTEEKCISCGLCVKYCFNDCWSLKPDKINKAEFRDENKLCNNCGHCIAICPSGAVTDDNGCSGRKIEESAIDILNSRRSVRYYSEKDVEEKNLQLSLIPCATRPSSHNSQPCVYHIIRDRKIIHELRTESAKTFELLKNLSKWNWLLKPFLPGPLHEARDRSLSNPRNGTGGSPYIRR